MKTKPINVIVIITIFITVLHAVQVASTAIPTFAEWAQQQGVNYATDIETSYRQAIYYQNVLSIIAHNADPTQTYKQGINQFTALTQK
jgi:hypothetical protein